MATNNIHTFTCSYKDFKSYILNGSDAMLTKFGSVDTEDVIEGEYEYLKCTRPCHSKVKFTITIDVYSDNGQCRESVLTKIVEYNTSSEFALFMCDINENSDYDTDSE